MPVYLFHDKKTRPVRLRDESHFGVFGSKTGQTAKPYPEPLKGYENGESQKFTDLTMIKFALEG